MYHFIRRQLCTTSRTTAHIALGLIAVAVSGCGDDVPDVEGIEVTLNAENFATEALDEEKFVLVDFGASWCGPCRQMEPVLAYLSEQYEGRVKVGTVDTDENAELANEYSIEGLPTFVLFRNGEEVDRVSGSMSYSRLSAWVDGHLSS